MGEALQNLMVKMTLISHSVCEYVHVCVCLCECMNVCKYLCVCANMSSVNLSV